MEVEREVCVSRRKEKKEGREQNASEKRCLYRQIPDCGTDRALTRLMGEMTIKLHDWKSTSISALDLQLVCSDSQFTQSCCLRMENEE